MLTVDLQVLGQRHCDVRNGLTVPPEIKIKNVIDIATKPAWALSILKGKRKTFGNLAGHVKGMENVNSLAQWTASQFDPTLSWKDVEWIKSIWPGKLILKGILDVEDAKIAVKTGADAISVSNHGGRQLDGAPSAISALPRVVDAVGSEIEVMFDCGIRTGADMMRALALGARSCIVGRSYIYGLGAGGQAGVARAIEILGRELDVTMALCGVKSVKDIDRRVLADFDERLNSRGVNSAILRSRTINPAGAPHASVRETQRRRSAPRRRAARHESEHALSRHDAGHPRAAGRGLCRARRRAGRESRR